MSQKEGDPGVLRHWAVFWGAQGRPWSGAPFKRERLLHPFLGQPGPLSTVLYSVRWTSCSSGESLSPQGGGLAFLCESQTEKLGLIAHMVAKELLYFLLFKFYSFFFFT